MINSLYIIVSLVLFSNSFAQDVSGVWITYNDVELTTKKNYAIRQNGLLVNFDKNTIGDIESALVMKMSINHKKSTIKADGVKGKLYYKNNGLDSMIIQDAKGKKLLLKKLDLSHTINMSKSDIVDFLVDQQCDPVQGKPIVFNTNKFSAVGSTRKSNTKKQLINVDSRKYGYWFIHKLNNNAFIVFALGENQPEYIYQIRSITLNGLKLHPIKENVDLKDLELLRTCL